jgi:hypothetical protein
VFPVVASRLSSNILFSAARGAINFLVLSSGQSTPIAGGGAASLADGVGSAAGFLSPTSMFLVNETQRAEAKLCVTCTVCPAGKYGMCNATASVCTTCLAGTYTRAAGLTACSPCPARYYGVPGGLCSPCPPGTSLSSEGGTACLNCSAGAYASAPGMACANCSGGTFSAVGSSACSACTNLIGNATYAGQPPGTNASTCPFVCMPGFSYAQGADGLGACPQCAVGQWSPAGATACSACSFLPQNATSNGTGSCAACAAGTRLSGGACVACLPGSYSDPAAVACTSCASGKYSTGGASACALCANQGPYTQFVGRGTALNCAFYCLAGAYVANRTACAPCANGTFAAAVGATRCTTCGLGFWSGLASTACTACSALQIVAVNGTGMLDYPFLAKAGWGVTSVVCVP